MLLVDTSVWIEVFRRPSPRAVPKLSGAVPVRRHDPVEKIQSLLEPPLIAPKGGLQIQDHGAVPQGIPDLLFGSLPQLSRLGERLLRAAQLPEHPPGVPEMGEREGTQAQEPLLLFRLSRPQPLRYQDCELGPLHGPGRILKSGLPAHPAEELAEAPGEPVPLPHQAPLPLEGEPRHPLPEVRR